MKGICILNDFNKELFIKYISPAGAGLGYRVIKVDENSQELWKQGKTVEFHISKTILGETAVIIPSLQDKMEKFFSKYNPFDSPHAGVSKLGTGPGKNKQPKEDIIFPKNIPERKENFGQLFFTKEDGWIIKYTTEEYKFKGTQIKDEKIKLHPNQINNLSAENDNEKKVVFEIVDFYVEPPETIHCNRGVFIKVAKIINDFEDFNTEIQLFHPETSSHEVFAIKNNTAFLGYKLPNGDFYFECVPYTEKASNDVQEYVQEQISLKNIEPTEKTWMESICQYWYNKGKKSNETKI